jgi:RimJ/RimL family protein N-acetyltransferase
MQDVPTLLLRTFSAPIELRTPRLLLRQWKDSDLDAWAEINADTEARKYFPSVMTREASEMEAARGAITQRGWGMWAVEVPSVFPFIGFIGLNPPGYPAPWQPAVEIGWRLSPAAWHQGYATEGAMASLQFAFTELALNEVLAFSVTTNTPSHNVMTRIGMTPAIGLEFDHPRVPTDWPLKRHIVHRITHEEWTRQHR